MLLTLLGNVLFAAKATDRVITACEKVGGTCSMMCGEIGETINGQCPDSLSCCKRKSLCTGENGLVGTCDSDLCQPLSRIIGLCEKDNKLCCGIGEYSPESGAFTLAYPWTSVNDRKAKEIESMKKSSTVLNSIISSEMFTFLAGTASILSLIIAIYYPAQIRNITPSEYRSLRWGKTVLMSFGTSVMIGAFAQFLVSIDGIEFMKALERLLTALKDTDFFESLILIIVGFFIILFQQKILVWVVVFIIGWVLLSNGTNQDPMKAIIFRLKDARKSLENERDERLQLILNNRDYEELTIHEKNIYKQTLNYFDAIQGQITKLLTGDSGVAETLMRRED